MAGDVGILLCRELDAEEVPSTSIYLRSMLISEMRTAARKLLRHAMRALGFILHPILRKDLIFRDG